jgi:hypothetical protein
MNISKLFVKKKTEKIQKTKWFEMMNCFSFVSSVDVVSLSFFALEFLLVAHWWPHRLAGGVVFGMARIQRPSNDVTSVSKTVRQTLTSGPRAPG